MIGGCTAQSKYLRKASFVNCSERSTMQEGPLHASRFDGALTPTDTDCKGCGASTWRTEARRWRFRLSSLEGASFGCVCYHAACVHARAEISRRSRRTSYRSSCVGATAAASCIQFVFGRAIFGRSKIEITLQKKQLWDWKNYAWKENLRYWGLGSCGLACLSNSSEKRLQGKLWRPWKLRVKGFLKVSWRNFFRRSMHVWGIRKIIWKLIGWGKLNMPQVRVRPICKDVGPPNLSGPPGTSQKVFRIVWYEYVRSKECSLKHSLVRRTFHFRWMLFENLDSVAGNTVHKRANVIAFFLLTLRLS